MTLQRFVERLIWLSMLPLAAWATVLVVTHIISLEQRRDRVAKAMVAAATASVQTLLEVRLSSLEQLARTLEALAVTPSGELQQDRARPLALHHVKAQGAHLMIGDRDDRMLLNTRVPPGTPLPPIPRPPGRSASDVALTEGIATVGDVQMGPIIKRWVVPLAVPIRFADTPRWTLLSPLELQEVNTRLSELDLPPRWSLQIRDSSGRAIVRVDSGGLADVFPDLLPLYHLLGQGDVHTARLGLAPWSVDLYAPPSDLLQDPQNQAMMLVISLLAASGAAYWSGRIVSHRLIRCMASLVDSVDDPPKGEDIEEVAAVRQALQRLQTQRESAAKAERRRLGLELHDDLQQKLALIRMDLARWRKTPTMTAAQREQETDRALGLVDQTIESTRRLVRNLRPPTLEGQGIQAAMLELAQLAQATHRPGTGMPMAVDVQVRGDEAGLDASPEMLLSLYRIAQEALNNIVKHAAARHVDLLLDLRDPHWVILEVVDDGNGFHLAAVTPAGSGDSRAAGAGGTGLIGMHERVQSLGGSLEIHTHPGEGTALIARLPRQDAGPEGPGPCAGVTAPPEA